LAYFENALNAYGATIVVDERHRLPILLRTGQVKRLQPKEASQCLLLD
jgi:hypothetical protein